MVLLDALRRATTGNTAASRGLQMGQLAFRTHVPYSLPNRRMPARLRSRCDTRRHRIQIDVGTRRK